MVKKLCTENRDILGHMPSFKKTISTTRRKNTMNEYSVVHVTRDIWMQYSAYDHQQTLVYTSSYNCIDIVKHNSDHKTQKVKFQRHKPPIKLVSTHWGRDKWSSLCRRNVQIYFHARNCFKFAPSCRNILLILLNYRTRQWLPTQLHEAITRTYTRTNEMLQNTLNFPRAYNRHSQTKYLPITLLKRQGLFMR